MTKEGEPTPEVPPHMGDQLLELYGMTEFGHILVDVGDGLGPVHPVRDYPYVTPHKDAVTMIRGTLSMPPSDPRRKVLISVGRRKMAERLGLVDDGKGGWELPDGTTSTGY